jgi:hypothetical protein
MELKLLKDSRLGAQEVYEAQARLTVKQVVAELDGIMSHADSWSLPTLVRVFIEELRAAAEGK